MRRVVVTGMGLVTPVGTGVEAAWQALLGGTSGAATITSFDTEGLATNYACQLKHGDGSAGTCNADDWIAP